MNTQQTTLDSRTRLLEHLRYDKDTGHFYWIKKTSSASRVNVGDKAGSIDRKGYTKIIFNGKSYCAHRLAWLFVYGEWPEDQIDHINRKKSDNRISNLRQATNQINHKNKPLQANNTSGHSGITRRYGGWRVRIGVDGKRVHGGDFKDLQEAIAARDLLKQRYGFHENHGVPI